MGFLDKAKAAAEQAATKAKEGVEDVQSKRELSQAYGDLGRAAYRLASAGEISHPELAALVGRISQMESPTNGGAGAAAGYGAPQTPA
ncbi:MAG: hypothetical protein M3018_04165 [Actinomycetota bacterium]|nr:hypothetical protein [Actinomycetota bacterium]